MREKPDKNCCEPEPPVCPLAVPHCTAPAQPRAPPHRVPLWGHRELLRKHLGFWESPDFTAGLGFAAALRSEHVALTPARCHPHKQSPRDSGEPPGVGWCPGRTGIPWCPFLIQAQNHTVPCTWSSSVPTSLLQRVPERHLPGYPLLTRHPRPIFCQPGPCKHTRAP